MQWLSLVTEDAGLQRLKADNRLPVPTRSIDPVAPYPATHSARIADLPQPQPSLSRERRKDDRRHGDRRKQQIAVILDTRCSSRRSLANRRSAPIDKGTQSLPGAHIDLYA